MLKVLGKGNKERLIPIGRQVQRLMWRHITRYRPEPANAKFDFLFLTKDGRPLTKDRVEKIMVYYGRKAGLEGVRCSPHTLRHSAAVRFLRMPSRSNLIISGLRKNSIQRAAYFTSGAIGD